MDNYVCEKLIQWELECLIDIFEEEGFDERAFQSLNYEAVVNLIEKQGVRAIFWKKYKEEFLNEANTLERTQSQIFPSSSGLQAQNSQIFECSRELPIYNDLKPGNLVKRYLHCTDGKLIEKYYKNNGNFDNNHRNLLAKVIIHKEYEALDFPKKFKISTDRFLAFNAEIAEIFPSEKNTLSLYYTPYDSITKRRASGKLWDNYNHLKAKLCTSDNKNEQNNNKVNKLITGQIEYLKEYIDPWPQILEFWRDTFDERKKLINKENSVLQYFEHFPILKTSKGALLLNNDFDKKYPESINKISTSWPQIELKLLKYAEKKNNKELLDIGKSNSTFRGLLILSHCLANSAYQTNEVTKKRRKLSKEEVTNCFLPLLEDGKMIIEKVKELKAAALNRKTALQPRIILIGTNYENITEAYVVVNETLYLFENVLLALDNCFKITHSLNCAYADECKPLWTFIQKYIYEISTEYDKNYASVTTLASELSIL